MVWRPALVLPNGLSFSACGGSIDAHDWQLLYSINMLKSSSHGARWWGLPQPTAIRMIVIKIYTAIDNLILIK